MTTNTVRLHRVLRASPEKIYRAFLDPAAIAKWLPPHGFTARVQHMDPQVGGTYRVVFTNFTSGQVHGFSGTYLELEPFSRIRYSDRFDDPNLAGEMETTVSLQPVSCGTALHIAQVGIPESIPSDACYLGWQDSLGLLTLLVEAQVAG